MNRTLKPSNGNRNSEILQLETINEGEAMPGNHSEKFNGTYKDIAEILGDAAAVKIWKRYAGIVVSFPKRLYSSEYGIQFIRENMGSMRPADMARALDITERRVRQIMKEIRENNENTGES